MIKNKKIIIGILLTIFFIITNTTLSLGLTDEDFALFKTEITIDTQNSKAIDKIVSILSVLTVVGIVLTVVLLAFMGFSSILGSASEKAEIQQKYMGFLIGAILMTSITAVAKFIISIAQNIQ